MRQPAFLFAAILVLAASAGAQASLESALPAAPVPANGIAPSEPSLFAVATTPALSASGDPGEASSGGAAASPGDQRPTVYGVVQTFNWQVNAGYTFFRFYILPGTTLTMNGINLGLVYYPGGKWYGGEGEFDGEWGSIHGISAKYVQALGGARFRWSGPRGIEVWGHGLIGGAHELPQTPFGGQGAFAYEVGGGVDLNIHQRRFAYRVGADLVGTRFFSTYQYSPKVSVAFVYKF